MWNRRTLPIATLSDLEALLGAPQKTLRTLAIVHGIPFRRVRGAWVFDAAGVARMRVALAAHDDAARVLGLRPRTRR